MYDLYSGPSNISIKAMFTLLASGLMCLPMMIYSCKTVASEITKRPPDDERLGHSRTGWMTAKLFDKYSGHIFTPHFGKHTVKFHVILFVN